ncbi:MAG: hypothetical protein ABIH34_07195, partial [Nanoarchaeota archaeon]
PIPELVATDESAPPSTFVAYQFPQTFFPLVALLLLPLLIVGFHTFMTIKSWMNISGFIRFATILLSIPLVWLAFGSIRSSFIYHRDAKAGVFLHCVACLCNHSPYLGIAYFLKMEKELRLFDDGSSEMDLVMSQG